MSPAESVAEQPVRDRIIDTATRLFYYRGIPATGVDTISDSAHVAKMSLYRHFRSKDQLILECLQRLDTRYHNWFVEQVRQRADDPAQALLSVFDVLDEWFNSPHFRGCAFINATVELADPAHRRMLRCWPTSGAIANTSPSWPAARASATSRLSLGN
jgi:AcrR family transcriptional regulator